MYAELTIVVVEDNHVLREEMVHFLSRHRWHAVGMDCGEELSEWLIEHEPDIAVLDVNLPYEDGYSIAKRLRESHPQVGIVMLTARVRQGERSAGYRAGADVYLTKPTDPEELAAVIQNLAGRLARTPVPHFCLDRQASTLSAPEGQACLLTPTELNLLALLALAPERALSKEALTEALARQEGKPVSSEYLAVLVSRLRLKCKQALHLEHVVVALRGIGYRLSLPLSLL